MCKCGCGQPVEAQAGAGQPRQWASKACRMRAWRADKAKNPASNLVQCQQCGGYKVGVPRKFICNTCANAGFESLLRVAPRAEGFPRLYFGYMNLMTQLRDGAVEAYTGDDEIKPVLKAFTEAMGGIYQDDAVVMTALIPLAALAGAKAA